MTVHRGSGKVWSDSVIHLHLRAQHPPHHPFSPSTSRLRHSSPHRWLTQTQFDEFILSLRTCQCSTADKILQGLEAREEFIFIWLASKLEERVGV